MVSKFSSSPTEAKLTVAKRILGYRKGTVGIAVKYQKSDCRTLMSYSFAHWAGDPDNRHSTTGNLLLMTQGPISWLSKKQSVVALSTSAAEYVAVSTATQDTVQL